MNTQHRNDLQQKEVRMTIAIAAMNAMLISGWEDSNMVEISKTAFQMADKMLKAETLTAEQLTY